MDLTVCRELWVRVPAALPMATNCAAASAWPQDSNPPTRNPERRPPAAPRSQRGPQRPMHAEVARSNLSVNGSVNAEEPKHAEMTRETAATSTF
jgi:hypothetical protein